MTPKRKRALWTAFAVAVGVAGMLLAFSVQEARSAVLARCPPNWQMTYTDQWQAACQPGQVTTLEYGQFWVVRVEDPQGPWEFREGFE